METIFYILAKTVSITLEVVSITMMIRMILSLFGSPENRLYLLTCYMTEPFIIPVRAVMVALNIGQDSPIDLAFFFTSILIWILQVFLPVI